MLRIGSTGLYGSVIPRIVSKSIGTINALFREICRDDLIVTGHFL